MTWETVIGLEIHVQLATKSKIFSPAAAGYCEEPNRQVREVDDWRACPARCRC